MIIDLNEVLVGSRKISPNCNPCDCAVSAAGKLLSFALTNLSLLIYQQHLTVAALPKPALTSPRPDVSQMQSWLDMLFPWKVPQQGRCSLEWLTCPTGQHQQQVHVHHLWFHPKPLLPGRGWHPVSAGSHHLSSFSRTPCNESRKHGTEIKKSCCSEGWHCSIIETLEMLPDEFHSILMQKANTNEIINAQQELLQDKCPLEKTIYLIILNLSNVGVG